MSYRKAILTLAYTIAARERTAESLGRSSGLHQYPGAGFQPAGENAILGKLSYDFSSLGLTGVTAYALWVHGWDRVDPITKASVKQEDEYDLDLQWRPQIKVLKGFWLRTVMPT